jgi:hypothetical protein
MVASLSSGSPPVTLRMLEDVAPDVDPLVDAQLRLRRGEVALDLLLAGGAPAVRARVVAGQRR